VGPGDDAAVFRGRPGTAAWAVTTDMLVEGVHFDLAWTSGEDLGWKALAVNLSDLAAMGPVRPALGVIALGLPSRLPVSFVDGFYRGFDRLARVSGFVLAGGDTVRADKLTVSLAALGEVPRGRRVLTRDGARPGDVLMATGSLGDAAAGLEILQKRPKGSRASSERFLIRRLLRPVPRLDLAGRLAAVPGVTAMMDSSDGLWRSAVILARASGVGLRIEAERLPVSPALRAWCGENGRDAVDFSLAGGEDYELVLTARPSAARRIEAMKLARPVGRAHPGRGVRAMMNGRPRSVSHEFEHFSQTA
jgi:thiamine-monophosphate kinase